MFVVHGTKKFLDRVHSGTPPAPNPLPATTILGAWYATVLYWQPRVALFVNEPTRLPLFVALAPGATVIRRMTQTATAVFTTLGLNEGFIAQEIAEMSSHQLAKTTNRSVLGTMTDFAYLADAPAHPTKRPTSCRCRFTSPRHLAGPSTAAASAQTEKSLPTSPNTPADVPRPEHQTQRANADQSFWHGTRPAQSDGCNPERGVRHAKEQRNTDDGPDDPFAADRYRLCPGWPARAGSMSPSFTTLSL